MTEPDVALTDFAIAVECGVFAIACILRAHSRWRDVFTAVFALTAVAAAAGGVLHGFASDPASFGYRVLWPLILLAIVGSSVALALGALELLDAGSRLRRAVWAVALAFGVAVLLGAQSFALAVGAYVPASLLLAYAFAKRYRRTREKRAACGAAGLLLGVAAGGLQQMIFTPWPGRVSPNAFFHLLQLLALALLFVASTDRDAPNPQAD